MTRIFCLSVLFAAIAAIGCRTKAPVALVPPPKAAVTEAAQAPPTEPEPVTPAVETPPEVVAAEPDAVTFVSSPFEIEPPTVPFTREPRTGPRVTEQRANRLSPPLKDSQLKFGPRLSAADQGIPVVSRPVLDQPELSRLESPRPALPAMPGGGKSHVAAPRGADPAPIVAYPPPILEKATPATDPSAPYARAVTAAPAKVGREGAAPAVALLPPDPKEATRPFKITSLPDELELPASANMPRVKLQPAPLPPPAP